MDNDKRELSPPIPSTQQDFYVWLRTIPLGVLYTLYKQYTARRGRLHATNAIVSNAQSDYSLSGNGIKNNKITLRKSVFILVLTFIYIEFFFDGIYVLLRLPSVYVTFPQILQSQITSIYFIAFVILNVLKILSFLFVCLTWITTIYEIKDGEIKFKYGIIVYNQKTYLCRYTQEVICKQGLVGKIFNFGSIKIYDPTISDGLNIDSVPNPNKYADIIKKNVLFNTNNSVEFIPTNLSPEKV